MIYSPLEKPKSANLMFNWSSTNMFSNLRSLCATPWLSIYSSTSMNYCMKNLPVSSSRSPPTLSTISYNRPPSTYSSIIQTMFLSSRPEGLLTMPLSPKSSILTTLSCLSFLKIQISFSINFTCLSLRLKKSSRKIFKATFLEGSSIDLARQTFDVLPSPRRLKISYFWLNIG